MNINTLSILSDAISDVGSWHRWFIRDNMVQVQFCDIMLYDENTSEKESHSTDVLAVRFSGNCLRVRGMSNSVHMIIDAMRRIIGLIIALLIVVLPALGESDNSTLLYMGQASLCIVTPEGKVIYIDPYAGDDYAMPADLILVNHGHFDHCAVDTSSNH